jgi:hypothetical protein
MLIEASYIRRCGLPRHHAFIHGRADGVHFARLPASVDDRAGDAMWAAGLETRSVTTE